MAGRRVGVPVPTIVGEWVCGHSGSPVQVTATTKSTTTDKTADEPSEHVEPDLLERRAAGHHRTEVALTEAPLSW